MFFSATVTTRAASNTQVWNFEVLAERNQALLFTQDPERDVKEVEQWLNIQDSKDANKNSNPQDGTTAAFNYFIQKRASTIPDEVDTEEKDYVNLQPAQNNPHN